MIKKVITVTREFEDPVKNAVEFVNMVEPLNAEITFQIQNGIYSGKSVISMMIHEFKNGKEFEFTCKGEEEEEAMKQIIKWFAPEHEINKIQE